MEIHNKIRGLSPYPTAWTVLEKDGVKKTMKLFRTKKNITGENLSGQIKVDQNLFFGARDGWVEISELQLEGKKRMEASDFLKGFDILQWKLQ